MILQSRRSFLRGFGSLLASPAIVQVKSIMPIKIFDMSIDNTHLLRTQQWNLAMKDHLLNDLGVMRFVSIMQNYEEQIVGPILSATWRLAKENLSETQTYAHSRQEEKESSSS